MDKLQIIAEYFQFLKQEKKWWMFPFIMILLIMSLAWFAQGSPLAPFIYTVF